MKIEIVGSLDGDLYYTVEQIDEILEQEQTELNYGAAFMGRPGTKIYTSPHHIVKLRTELDLNPVKEEWLDQLTTFNLNARYDSYKQDFYKHCTREFANEWKSRIEELRKWLQNHL